tara:strand:+ start:2597 stop:4489 length:1893 start_codon:yes stop_codon:yes gene_type:complete
MPFTQFTSLDFDEIKASIKDYIKANTEFTDYDYEGTNLSVLINILAYNTYLTAYNSNMVANEVFLDTATLRENIVSLARNVGYVPKSRRASRAVVSFSVTGLPAEYRTVTLESGLVCVGAGNNNNLKFSIPERAVAQVDNGTATFSNITVYEGTLLTQNWTVVGNESEIKYELDNSFVDTSTIRVNVKNTQTDSIKEDYSLVDNIIKVKNNSRIYLIQETTDERYRLLFGDGIIGKKLENNNYITASYITTLGEFGNGASNFIFSGILFGNNNENNLIDSGISLITTVTPATGGAEIESASSIKYFSTRLYSSQYRAVTARDYEAIIPYVYDNVESVSAYGGEELNPPQYGKVFAAVKPKNSNYLSSFAKRQILDKLRSYTVAGIVPELVDLKYLTVETTSSVYYNSSFVSDTDALKERITNTLLDYSRTTEVNKFGGRFKYSKVSTLIDQSDQAVISNITKVKMVRNMRVRRNTYNQYELCFGNKFYINPSGYNIKSTGFSVSGMDGVLYFSDIPTSATEGRLFIFKLIPQRGVFVVKRDAGKVNYNTGEILIDTISISNTQKDENVIEFEVSPDSNDVIGKQDLYVQYAVNKSEVTMVLDTITSGYSNSGSSYASTSSYPSTTNYIRA